MFETILFAVVMALISVAVVFASDHVIDYVVRAASRLIIHFKVKREIEQFGEDVV
jgi:hypothetical protein